LVSVGAFRADPYEGAPGHGYNWSPWRQTTTGLPEENWYYYWKQTPAFCGEAADVHWGGTMNPPYYAFTQWCGSELGDQSWYGPHIVDMVNGEQAPLLVFDGPDQGRYRSGIDIYGVVVRHEDRHRELNSTWFPQGWPWPATDNDEGMGDLIPDAVEPTLPQSPAEGGPFLANDRDSDGDGHIDGEDYVFWTQQYYTMGTDHSSDWSYRGFQYNQ
jgi:hypothetical protein